MIRLIALINEENKCSRSHTDVVSHIFINFLIKSQAARAELCFQF
jgi:hypothetical protein